MTGTAFRFAQQPDALMEASVVPADDPGLTRCGELARSEIGQYHYNELKIALNPAHGSHYLPNIPAGAKVLDIGCGAGQILIATCPYRTPGEGGLCVPCSRTDCPTWGYGVDIDAEAIALGKAWSRRMVLRTGTAENLPYGDQEFDMVISRVTLCFVDMRRALDEIKRVLRPGGRIWLSLHPFSWVLSQLNYKSWKALLVFAYVAMNGLFFYLSLRTFPVWNRREYWQSGTAMRRILKKAGFHNIQTESNSRRLIVSAEL